MKENEKEPLFLLSVGTFFFMKVAVPKRGILYVLRFFIKKTAVLIFSDSISDHINNKTISLIFFLIIEITEQNF